MTRECSGKVFDFGDHGATSIWVDVRGTFLYMTYMLVDPQNPGIKNTCTDSGEMVGASPQPAPVAGTRSMTQQPTSVFSRRGCAGNKIAEIHDIHLLLLASLIVSVLQGRPDDQIKGCRTFGMMSRWPLDANGNIVGGEQVVLNGYQEVTVGAETTYLMCAQFSTHSMCSVVQDPITKTLYVSASDGAGFAGTDWGQFGGNPCHDRAAYGGAFRALDPVGTVGSNGAEEGSWVVVLQDCFANSCMLCDKTLPWLRLRVPCVSLTPTEHFNTLHRTGKCSWCHHV